MTAYLALRHTPPTGALSKAAAWIIKIRLVTKYPHAGIVVDNVLYHATATHGVSCEQVTTLDGWTLFKIRKVKAATMVKRFEQVRGRPYDWFSLLAFVLPFRMSASKWFYCYELCNYMMSGKTPPTRITPETLLSQLH